MKSQIEFIHEVAALHAANPEYEIHFCVDSDESVLDDSSWVAHKITKVEVRPWLIVDEKLIDDAELIWDHFENEFWDEASGQELKNLIENAVADVPLAICIYTNAG